MTKAERKAKQRTVVVDVMKPTNYVAKHCREFNNATVETDRKKESKKNGGENTKHKNKQDW